jgi:Flp pilus assembly protein TadD
MVGFEALRDGPESARASLEAWVEELEARIESEPGNAELRQKIAGTYAQLGNAAAAVREGRMAVDLTARDRWSGPKAEQALAAVYAELGRTDDALDLIRKLLEMTYEDSITLANLRLLPPWDKLRDDERFRALVAE